MPACLPRCSCDKVGRAHPQEFTTSCTQCFLAVRSPPAHLPRACYSPALNRPPTPSSWQVRRDVKRLCRASAACQSAASRTTNVAAAGCVLAGTAVIHSAGCVASVLVRRVCPFHVISCRVRFSVECACPRESHVSQSVVWLCCDVILGTFNVQSCESQRIKRIAYILPAFA